MGKNKFINIVNYNINFNYATTPRSWRQINCRLSTTTTNKQVSEGHF